MVVIEDDGAGFDVEGGVGQSEGLGLRSMRERVRMLGGRMTIVSGEKAGTKVLIEIPNAAAEASQETERSPEMETAEETNREIPS